MYLQGTKVKLTPFQKPKNAELLAPQRRFNYLHSINRGSVERGLGIVKCRSRWMLRGIQLRSIESYVAWFEASLIVHNLCIDFGEDPELLSPEPGDERFGGLVGDFDRLARESTTPGDKEFTAAVAKALEKRTEEAAKQARYGLLVERRRKTSAGGAAASAASAVRDDADDEPDVTGEQDEAPAASVVMADAPDGHVLRQTLFAGLGIRDTAVTANAGRKKARRMPSDASVLVATDLDGTT